jgi:hypothetical protein
MAPSGPEMSPPPGRSEREGSSAGAWIRKREDARAAGVRASCVSVSVEQRCDTRPVAEAAMGLAPCLLSRLSSAGSVARAGSPNSCTHSESMAARSQLLAFECGPQYSMYRESLAAIQPLPSPMPTFRCCWRKNTPRHTQVSFLCFRQYRQAGWADFRRIIPAPQNQKDSGISGSRSGGK